MRKKMFRIIFNEIFNARIFHEKKIKKLWLGFGVSVDGI
jgi:hypothetical protein